LPIATVGEATGADVEKKLRCAMCKKPRGPKYL